MLSSFVWLQRYPWQVLLPSPCLLVHGAGLGGGAGPFGAETELGIQPDAALAGGGPRTTVLDPFP